MTNVVPLRREPEPDMVWQCECGCSTHYAHLDGTLECAGCGVRHPEAGGEWRETLPPPNADAPPSKAEPTVMVRLDSPEVALKRVLSRANADETGFVIVAQNSGAVSVWGDVFDTRTHRGWLNRRLATAKSLLIEKKP